MARGVRAALNQEHRYTHCVRVARCADILAQRHGADAGSARVAGMLHDIARLYDCDDLIAQCRSRRMPIDAFEAAHPIVLHARLGAAIARERFDVRDPAVLSAIEKHTIACPGMSDLDRIVYLADSLEPERQFAERPDVWQLALGNLAAGMRATIALSLRHCAQRGLTPAPQTLAAAGELGILQQEVCTSPN